MTDDDVSWRSANFRQVFVNKINEEVFASGIELTTNSADMESHVYHKAKNKDEYLGLIYRLITHFRTIIMRNSIARGRANELNLPDHIPAAGDLAQSLQPIYSRFPTTDSDYENTGTNLRGNTIQQLNESIQYSELTENAVDLEGRVFRDAANENEYRAIIARLNNYLRSLGSRNRRAGALDLTMNTGSDFLNQVFSQPDRIGPNMDDLVDRVQETVSYDSEEIGKLSLSQLGLEEETSQANSASGMCCICHEMRATIAIVPCYHLCLCFSCSERSRELAGLCPLCRGVIQRLQRIYL